MYFLVMFDKYQFFVFSDFLGGAIAPVAPTSGSTNDFKVNMR